MNRETVGATPALTIDGDLDAETGDIDTNQAVRIGGSVLPSLTIKAGGTVDIAGEVQTGARIDAQGDVSAGSLTGALVRAGGRLVVGDPDLGDGSIVGGEAYAVTALNVNGSVGSRGTTPTTAGIMSDPVIVARLAKAREGIEFCQRDILRIFRTLDLQSIDKAQVQALFQRLTPNKKPFAIALLKQLNQLAGVRDELRSKRQEQEDRHARQLQDARLTVSATAFSGTRIRLGESDFLLTQDLLSPSFFLADGVIAVDSP